MQSGKVTGKWIINTLQNSYPEIIAWEADDSLLTIVLVTSVRKMNTDLINAMKSCYNKWKISIEVITLQQIYAASCVSILHM